MTVHRFRFDPAYRLPALAFGVTPATTRVEVTSDRLTTRFGPWRLETTLDNIASTEVSGDYAYLKTVGPAHLSFTDRGVTFATCSGPGLCVRFHEPVPAIDWFGVIKHPGLTVTVEDPELLQAELTG